MEWMFGIVLVVAVMVVVIAYEGNRRLWRNRPKRLCTNCYAVEQPLQLKSTREWYCPSCQAKNPVPLDSPAAQAYFGRR